MFIYQIQNGKVINAGAGDVPSSDPTAFINVSQAWAAEKPGRSVIVQEQRARLPQGKPHAFEFLKVNGSLVEAMTEAEIAAVETDKENAKQTEKQNRKARKRAVWQVFNVQPADRPAFLRGLKELLEDGDDN